MLLVKVGMKSLRITYYDEKNEEGLRANLDLLDEVRSDTLSCILAQKQKVARYCNSWVCRRTFKVGDLILRKAKFSEEEKQKGKLTAKWYGLYEVIIILRPRHLSTATMDKEALTNPWNIEHLKIFFQ